ncbi:MAG: HAD-IB family phosphatase, partial [Alphaproteobacteria bacterium]|nr:HAD-IB family phosphatase [Alphaproteobacteria bacterium]
MPLGEALSDACAQVGLVQAGQTRLLGNEEKWAAVELSVSLGETGLASARDQMQTLLGSDMDLALVPSASRRKKLLISDMDSTIIQQECLDELADYAGLKTEIAAITARAMAGELDFEGALIERVSMLKGLNLQALADCYRERITLMPGAETLTATMAAHGAHCLLVSGGFTYFTSRVADTAGFHDH